MTARVATSLVLSACLSCAGVTVVPSHRLWQQTWQGSSDAALPSSGSEMRIQHFHAMLGMFEALEEASAHEHGVTSTLVHPNNIPHVPYSAIDQMVADWAGLGSIPGFSSIRSFRTAFAQWLTSSDVSSIQGLTVFPLSVPDSSARPYGISLADGQWHARGTQFEWSKDFGWEHGDIDFSGVFDGVAAPQQPRRRSLQTIASLVDFLGWIPSTPSPAQPPAAATITSHVPGADWTNNVISSVPIRAEADVLSKFSRSHAVCTNPPTFSVTTDSRLWTLTCDTERIRAAVTNEIEQARRENRDPGTVRVEGVFSATVTNWSTTVQGPTFSVGCTDSWSISQGVEVSITGGNGWYEPHVPDMGELTDCEQVVTFIHDGGVQVTADLYSKTVGFGEDACDVNVVCPVYAHSSSATHFTDYPFPFIGGMWGEMTAVYWTTAQWSTDDGRGATTGEDSIVTSAPVSAANYPLECIFSKVGMSSSPIPQPNPVDPSYDNVVTVEITKSGGSSMTVYYAKPLGEDYLIELGTRDGNGNYSGPIQEGPFQYSYSANVTWENDGTHTNVVKSITGSVRLSAWADFTEGVVRP